MLTSVLLLLLLQKYTLLYQNTVVWHSVLLSAALRKVFWFVFFPSRDEKKIKPAVTIIWDLQSSVKWAQASHFLAKVVARSQPASQPASAVLSLLSTEGPLDL